MKKKTWLMPLVLLKINKKNKMIKMIKKNTKLRLKRKRKKTLQEFQEKPNKPLRMLLLRRSKKKMELLILLLGFLLLMQKQWRRRKITEQEWSQRCQPLLLHLILQSMRLDHLWIKELKQLETLLLLKVEENLKLLQTWFLLQTFWTTKLQRVLKPGIATMAL